MMSECFGRPWILVVLSSLTAFALAGCSLSTQTPAAGAKGTPSFISSSGRTQEHQSGYVIVDDASKLNLTIEDFPLGWQIESQGESEGGHQVRFMRLGTIVALPEKIVASWLRVFPTVEDASNGFVERRRLMAERFRLDDPGISDESFFYEGNATDEVSFTTRNVLAQVTMYTQYGGSLNEVKKWAEALEARIERIKSLSPASVGRGPITPTERTAVVAAATPLSGQLSPITVEPTAVPPRLPVLTITPVPVSTPVPPSPTPPPRTPLQLLSDSDAGSLISFSSYREGTTKIFLTNLDGSDVVALTTDYGSGPAWSPDGKQLAFNCNPPGQGRGDICVMNADGSGIRNLTSNPAREESPIWSPDGRRVAFHRFQGDQADIFVMNSDGTDQLNITNNPGNDEYPVWSPDSSSIAFLSSRLGRNPGVFVANADGTAIRALTPVGAQDSSPSWSPDGRWIAFASYRDDGWGIYAIQIDGENLRRLPGGQLRSTLVSWSPDGRHIAFVSKQDGGGDPEFGELYITRPDGTGQTRLTRNGRVKANVSWSSDSSRVSFVSLRDGNREVYVVNVDGTGERNITNHPGDDGNPRWQPAP